MSFAQKLKTEWLSNPKNDILAGMTVAFALIPEAIAFSMIAGVDPMVGLYTSFCIAVIIAISGGRPAMISAATGAMALLMGSLVAEHGLEYLFAATVVTGIIQFILGVLKVGKFITFIPHPVMTGLRTSYPFSYLWRNCPILSGKLGSCTPLSQEPWRSFIFCLV